MTNGNDIEASEDSDASEHFEVYADYNKTVRTWLVAYGIGAPVLLLNSDKLRATIATSGYGRIIAVCFLTGAVFQVSLAILNKAISWILFDGHRRDRTEGKAFCAAVWLSRQFWIDCLADVASCVLFGYATWLIFKIILP